ncbi:MAG: ATP-dependent helicase [Candidatus Promineifilaceae bacterium]|jgi:DNA helicase-2/ATP-dependent DNA helicase PcrA
MISLRPAQEKIIAYRNGRMAVSAVPGSGKTFTLALLTSKLLAEGYAGDNPFLNPNGDQRVLIVTYLNASVDTFRARVRKNLEELELPPDHGYDVRTLHSLALEIVRVSESGLGPDTADPTVTDETQSNHFLGQALDNWIEAHPDLWAAFEVGDSPRGQTRWRDTVLRTARSLIRAAKNERYSAHDIESRLHASGASGRNALAALEQVETSPLLIMLAGIYDRYQRILDQQGVLDFDDLIWRATDLLEARPDLVKELQRRWPYVLEDEAQDSVPLQEVLLSTLTGAGGNWVRVGDPNQAITSTFTAAHPQFFNDFIDREDVLALPLPNSGRSAPIIFTAANKMVDWVIDHHPIPEVRSNTFRRQHILAAPPGDAQQNPSDAESEFKIKVYKHREDEELPAVAKLAAQYAKAHPHHTLAILVPTHNIGYITADGLDELEASYDNLLRGGTREREIATAMNSVLAVLANPQDGRALAASIVSLHELGHPAASFPEESLSRLTAILKSVYQPESFLFPWAEEDFIKSLPANVASEEDIQHITRFSIFLQKMFEIRTLPVDDLALTLGDELFSYEDAHESDLAIAYQLAIVLRYWQEMHPDWRLPELSAELASLAAGRRGIPLARPGDYGFEPQPGRITLSTQHSAKGLEWDAVFLVGIDGFWIPSDLEAPFHGVHEYYGDLIAESLAQLRFLMQGDAGLHKDLTATDSAHIEVISERLRLLYVGITRARRYLHISRSRATGSVGREKPAEPATVLGLLYNYLKSLKN